jgi:acetylornithine deacetylase/succinyl-diaminopimelate desuccinylase-like protein
MGHSDTVNIDQKKWTHPPFSAARVDGHIYGRGTVDDKDNVVAGLMTLIALKRGNVPLDRDVILLVEAGEEGTTRVGIKFMTEQHFPKIDAEYCFAEGANVVRGGGQVKFAGVQTLEKIPRAIELLARGVSGHGSVPLRANAVVRLAAAVARIGAWKPEIRLTRPPAPTSRGWPPSPRVTRRPATAPSSPAIPRRGRRPTNGSCRTSRARLRPCARRCPPPSCPAATG